MRNQVVLGGVVTQQETLRYTPAGLPCFTGVLNHNANKEQSDTLNLTFNVLIIAFGEEALALSQLTYPQELMIKGKLIKKHANSKELVIQVNQFKLNDGV